MAKKSTERSKPALTFTTVTTLILGSALIVGDLILNQKPAKATDIVVYKSPTCGCCSKWVDHLRDNGFTVETHNHQDMAPIKANLGIPLRLQSCHTAKVGDYLVEGHVPANEIDRLLKEKPPITGLAVPGMPMGSPGMEGPRSDPYDVLTFDKNGKIGVFAHKIREE